MQPRDGAPTGASNDPAAIPPRSAHDARTFFATLYPESLPRAVGVLTLRAPHPTRGSVAIAVRRVPLDAGDRAERLATGAAELEAVNVQRIGKGKRGGGVYVAIAARRDGATTGLRHGGGEAIEAVTALWAEIDLGVVGHAAEGLPPDVPAALSILAAMAAPEPTIIVGSGGGLHVYWTLETPIFGPAGRGTLAHRSLAAWRARLEAAGAATSYTVDGGPCEPVRLFRAPGSANWKKLGEPRPVRLLECEPARRYSLRDLVPEALAEPETRQRAEPTARRAVTVPGWTAPPPGDSSAAALDHLARVRAALRSARGGQRHVPALAMIPPLSGRDDLALSDAEGIAILTADAVAGGMAADDLGTIRDAWEFGRAAMYTPTGAARWPTLDTGADANAEPGGPPCRGWLADHTTAEALASIDPGKRRRAVRALTALCERAAAFETDAVFMGRLTLAELTGMGERTAGDALADIAALPFIARRAPAGQSRGGGRYTRGRLAPEWRLLNTCCRTVEGHNEDAHQDRCATCVQKSVGRGIIADLPVRTAAVIHPRTAEPSPALAAMVARTPIADTPAVLERAAAAGDVAAARMTLPGELVKGVAIGEGPAAALRAIADADGALTVPDVAEATGTRRGQTARRWCAVLEARGLVSGEAVASTGGRPARVYAVTATGRAALEALAPCAALAERRRRAASAARAGIAQRAGKPDTRAGLPDDIVTDAAALRADRRRIRCSPPPTTGKRHVEPIIAETPAETAERLAADVPPVPASYDRDAAAAWAALDAAPLVLLLDAAAIRAAAAELDRGEPGELSARLPTPPVRPPPTIPVLSAQQPLRQRTAGARPALAVLPGGRRPGDAAGDDTTLDRLLDALDDAAPLLERRRAAARPALAVLSDGAL